MANQKDTEAHEWWQETGEPFLLGEGLNMNAEAASVALTELRGAEVTKASVGNHRYALTQRGVLVSQGRGKLPILAPPPIEPSALVGAWDAQAVHRCRRAIGELVSDENSQTGLSAAAIKGKLVEMLGGVQPGAVAKATQDPSVVEVLRLGQWLLDHGIPCNEGGSAVDVAIRFLESAVQMGSADVDAWGLLNRLYFWLTEKHFLPKNDSLLPSEYPTVIDTTLRLLDGLPAPESGPLRQVTEADLARYQAALADVDRVGAWLERRNLGTEGAPVERALIGLNSWMGDLEMLDQCLDTHDVERLDGESAVNAVIRTIDTLCLGVTAESSGSTAPPSASPFFDCLDFIDAHGLSFSAGSVVQAVTVALDSDDPLAAYRAASLHLDRLIAAEERKQ